MNKVSEIRYKMLSLGELEISGLRQKTAFPLCHPPRKGGVCYKLGQGVGEGLASILQTNKECEQQFSASQSSKPQRRKNSREYKLDASFLLTAEVILLTVHLFYLRWGNRKQKRPNIISGQGEP